MRLVCKERRAALKEERPDLQFGKLGAKLGEMWRTMSAEEKRPYESRATGDRDRYKAEMGSYQSANMLKGNAMSQLGLADDGYGNVKKPKLDDGSGLVGMAGGLDYSSLDPAQLEMLQQQQQFMQTFQQQQMAVGMQQAAAMQQQQAQGADLSGAYAQAAQAQLQASSSAAADTTAAAAGTKNAAGNSSSKQSEADEGEDDEDGSEEDDE